MNNPFFLNNKKILVTGASSGIGKAISYRASEFGAKLYITGRDEKRLLDTYKSLDGNGHEMIVGDLMETKLCGNILNSVVSLDGIVHSAGILNYVPLKVLREEVITHTMMINYIKPNVINQQLVKDKKINKNSSIVFISSVSGLIGGAFGLSAYAGSKGALIATTKVLAVELAKQKIRVNSIAPGVVKTPMTEKTNQTVGANLLDEDEKKYPLGYGQPDDVAWASIYLLSDASRWVTGSTIVLDGGLSCV